MGIKRPLEDKEFPDPPFSLPKPLDNNKKLNLNTDKFSFICNMDPGRISSNQTNEVNELPLGYRFYPTSSEVLQYYLVPKLKGEPLPSGYIKDLDVYQFDPHQIPLNEFKYAREDEAYFFVPVTSKLVQEELLQGESNLTRATPNGYWQSYERNIPLYARDESNIGYKNKLVFYNGKDIGNGVKTDWRLVEYWTNFRVDGNLGRCMVCKIHHKVKVEEIPEKKMQQYQEAAKVQSRKIIIRRKFERRWTNFVWLYF